MATETYTLKHPFEYKGETISEVTIRRPKVRDLRKSDGIKNDFEKSIAIMCDLTELAQGAVHELDGLDFNEISKIVKGFMGNGDKSAPQT